MNRSTDVSQSRSVILWGWLSKVLARMSFSTSPNFSFATEKTLVSRLRHFCLPFTRTRA